MNQNHLSKKVQIEEHDSFMTVRLPSDRALVSAALRASRACLRGWGVAQAEPVLIALRELLVNAIVHGNQSDPDKQVTCKLAKAPDDGLSIQVDDEGAGLDPSLLDMKLPGDPKRIEKRGLVLVQAMSETVFFDSAKGRATAYIIPGKKAVDPKKESGTLKGVSHR